jgi:hypothetical protein
VTRLEGRCDFALNRSRAANLGVLARSWQIKSRRSLDPSFYQPRSTNRSMPEVVRCNTIEVGEPVVRAGSKIEACQQVEQALIGAIRDRDRQRFLVNSFDIAVDEIT